MKSWAEKGGTPCHRGIPRELQLIRRVWLDAGQLPKLSAPMDEQLADAKAAAPEITALFRINSTQLVEVLEEPEIVRAEFGKYTAPVRGGEMARSTTGRPSSCPPIRPRTPQAVGIEIVMHAMVALSQAIYQNILAARRLSAPDRIQNIPT